MSRKRRHEDASSEDVFVYDANTDLDSIPEGITSLRIDSSVKCIPPRAFKDQESLVNVEYEEGLEVIGENAFCNCQSLRKQQFPSTLVEIGEEAFGDCEQLESVGRLPPNLKVIRQGAFSFCFKLQSIETQGTIRLEDRIFEICSSLTHFRLPQGMVTIPRALFVHCESLVEITVPSSVIEIGDHAFFGCEKLAMINLSSGLKTIGDGSFAENRLLQHFHFPTTVESIGCEALAFCDNLESVILPPKLEVIPQSTFRLCDMLTDVDIPQSVVLIGDFAFYRCNLTRLDLSRLNLASIGEYAFATCHMLEDIILPRTSLKRIEKRCFESCWSMTHLWIPPSVEYIEDGAFYGCTSLLSVEAPETLKRLVFVCYPDLDSDIYSTGYDSLVNIFLPPSHQFESMEYGLMEDMKLLQEAEGNYPGLVDKLKWRFNDLPLHRACYFHSYHGLQENISEIKSIVRTDQRACERVDFLGMTPFHILALSRKPWLSLFQELLLVSSVDIMECRDIFGSSPFDYLCKNHSSSAACVTISLLVTVMEPRISFLGLEWWRDDIMSGLEKVKVADPTLLATEVTSVCKKLAKFERMEVLSLLELTIWRMNVREANVTGSDARESCRINCGSSIVLERVIPFLVEAW